MESILYCNFCYKTFNDQANHPVETISNDNKIMQICFKCKEKGADVKMKMAQTNLY
jgi:hypothetical protein